MATELFGAKMIAPFFGSSLYVWSAVLAVTLGGLAAGYLTGGFVSTKRNTEKKLYLLLLAAASFISFMPLLSKIILQSALHLNLLGGLLISSLLILLPPVFLMGMSSPLIVQQLSGNNNSGEITGKVYAISTLGGIIATLFSGFYIIPEFGITLPCILTGVLLSLLPAIKLFKNDFKIPFIVLFFFVFNTYFSITKNKMQSEISYLSEGLLGQVMVVNYKSDKPNNDYKILFVNRIAQSYFKRSEGDTMQYPYIKTITENLSATSGKNALVLGLGGGTISNELIEKNYSVDVCELDERIYEVAQRYFSLSNKCNVYIDDARHYINTCKKKYDVIIMDMFRGEENPAHCFTTESFNTLKSILNKNGKLIINANGFYDNEAGLGFLSIIHTLNNCGYNIRIETTENEQSLSNQVVFASPDYTNNEILIKRITEKDFATLSTKGAKLLTDDCSGLDKLNLQAYRSWRLTSAGFFKEELKSGRNYPLFNQIHLH